MSGSAAAGLLRRAGKHAWQAGRKVVAGQPTVLTHPQLLGEGELVPGISTAEFEARRRRLAAALPPNSLAILPAEAIKYMSGVIPYPYRQHADLDWLTGLRQPDTLAVLESACRGGTFTLFVPDQDSKREVWTGPALNADAAVEVFGADEAYPYSEVFGRRFTAMLASAQTVVYEPGRNGGQLQRSVPALYRALEHGQVKSSRAALDQLRWVKSDAELALMRQSAHTSAVALRRCMALSHGGASEHNVAATFEFECKLAGAERMAYPLVVAGGPAACTIHYGSNDKLVHAGELLLMDAGCERHGYVSDVTRTWPVSGLFSEPQLAVYSLVLEVYRRCLEICRAGSTLREVHQLSVQLLSQAIARLGLCGSSSAPVIAAGQYSEFFPHSIGHWLGMDTHDTGSVSHDKPMEPGVVMALEPGLYVPDDPARFGPLAGIGVRIEDNVAITLGEPEVLSAAVPVEPHEIQALVRTKPPRN